MKEIIEYLELIKDSIALKDDALIAKQLKRIKELDINNNVVHIVTLLDRNKYNLGSILIDKIILDERELETLRAEQKQLDDTLHFLNKEKNELLQKIDAFNSSYYKELGPLVKETLKVKRVLLKMQINNSRHENTDILKTLLSETNDEYRQFSFLLREEESKQPPVLTKVEKLVLKDTYSEAMKLCHPDMIVPYLRNNVEEIFDELNSAYINHNLKKVKEIKERVTNRSGKKNLLEYKRVDKDEIHNNIIDIKKRIGQKKVEVAYLYHNETYQRIQKEMQDGDYFGRTKKLLELELLSLNEKLEIQTDTEYVWMQVLWSWAEQENIDNFPKNKEELMQIDSLDISHKNLDSLPEEIGMLTTLTTLNASYNQLCDLPKSIVELKELIYLNLEHNKIKKLSKNIGKLINLEILNLEYNQLIRVPNSISNLVHLTQLKLSYNKLTKLPESISNLENLRGLFLKGNTLSS